MSHKVCVTRAACVRSKRFTRSHEYYTSNKAWIIMMAEHKKLTKAILGPQKQKYVGFIQRASPACSASFRPPQQVICDNNERID